MLPLQWNLVVIYTNIFQQLNSYRAIETTLSLMKQQSSSTHQCLHPQQQNGLA